MEARIPEKLRITVASVLKTYRLLALETMFVEAGAQLPSSGYVSSKELKLREWLQVIDADPEQDALGILGKILQEPMENPPDYIAENGQRRLNEALAACGLSYQQGGKIFGGPLFMPSKSLADFIRAADLPAINAEFDRAYAKLTSDPPGAATAACTILEATCKTIIAEDQLERPEKLSLQPLWVVVQRHLGIVLGPAATR